MNEWNVEEREIWLQREIVCGEDRSVKLTGRADGIGRVDNIIVDLKTMVRNPDPHKIERKVQEVFAGVYEQAKFYGLVGAEKWNQGKGITAVLMGVETMADENNEVKLDNGRVEVRAKKIQDEEIELLRYEILKAVPEMIVASEQNKADYKFTG